MIPCITTFSGKMVNPLALRPEDIDIQDIAHSLACINRFNGHTCKPVSVAQHSWYVSRLAGEGQVGLQGLLHDASEAYLGDVTKWLKMTPAFAAYREAEERAQTLIFETFGLPKVEATSVTEADVLMVRFEGTRTCVNWRSDHPRYGRVTDAEVERIGLWTYWDWITAEHAFLERFYELTRGSHHVQRSIVDATFD